MVPGASDPLRAVLFDMDGVLIDSAAVIEAAWSAVHREHAGRELTAELVREHVHGCPGDHTVAALFPQLSAEEQRAVWEVVDRWEETAAYSLIPGARDLLAALNQHGIPVGLVTSSWAAKIEHVLDLLDLPEPFAAIVSRDDVVEGKPSPEPYRTGCARLGVAPEQVLVFEDAVSGVRSAVAAGTRCLGIGGAELTEVGAFAVLPDLTALRLVSDGEREFCLTGTAHELAFSRAE